MSIVRSSICFMFAIALAGCQTSPSSPPPSVIPPGAPAVTATANNGAGVAFTATVVYNAAGPTWTYTVASATGAPISNIELVTPVNLKDCTLAPPATPVMTENGATKSSTNTWKTTKTSAGAPIGFSDGTGAASVTFSITCNKRNGPVYLLVSDVAGTTSGVTNAVGQNTIGPLAGPV
jgi:hypothetical protein